MWMLILIVLLALPSPILLTAQDASPLCADYETQDDAQAAFDKDPGRLSALDDDADGLACEHLPAAETPDDASVFPWIAGGLVALGGIAGAVIILRRRRHSSNGAGPAVPGVDTAYDPAVELELELIKSERKNIKMRSWDIKKPPTPESPDAGGSGSPDL
jgi:hypothetical protein